MRWARSARAATSAPRGCAILGRAPAGSAAPTSRSARRARPASSTPTTAAATGARYAVGFQRTEWNSVQTLTGGADKIALNAGLLSSQIPDFVSDGSYGQWYVDRAAAQNLSNNELYKIELKGIAFATRILSRSVGKANYPCEQPGCFHCFTLRGDQNNYDQYFSIDTGGGSRTWTANMLGLTCTFNVPITTTMVAFGWLPITVPVTARVYVPVQNQAGAVYDPN